ncbi:MAG: hypothetical protein SGPRY_012131, partial [Prymnesium sp.]
MALLSSHSFSASHEGEELRAQLLLCEGGVYLWVGTAHARMDSLAASLPPRRGGGASSVPVGSTIMGGEAGGASQAMAGRLSRRLGRPAFVSLSISEEPGLQLFVL